MRYFDEQPDYNRHDIHEYLPKLKFKFKEYSDIFLDDLINWCSKINKEGEHLHRKIIIDVDTRTDPSAGCDSGPTYIEFNPYYIRPENDKEYNERILEEETEYKDTLMRKKLAEKYKEEYQKDMDEYERIKNKYCL